MITHNIIIVIRFFINRGNIHISGPLPGSWLAAGMADLTPDLQVCLSRGSIAESLHSLQSLSLSCFHVILGLPSTCRSKAVLTAPLERTTCPYQQSLLSFRMRSRSLKSSRASSSLDLVVILQICLIISLSFRYRHWRFVFVIGQISLAGSKAVHTYMSWKRGCGKRELPETYEQHKFF